MKADTITTDVKQQVEQTAAIISDGSTSYTKLKEFVQSHKSIGGCFRRISKDYSLNLYRYQQR